MTKNTFYYIRQLIARLKKRYVIHKIEKAMGFRLTEWQIRYIFEDACERSVVRRSGRTTAHIIRLCLSKGEPLTITLPLVQKEYLDEVHSNAYRHIYGKMLMDIYHKLKKQRLNLREIIFVRYPDQGPLKSHPPKVKNR